MVDYRLAGTSSIDVIAYDRGTYTQDFNGLPVTGSQVQQSLAGSGPVSLGSSSIQAQGMLGWSIGRFGGTSSNVLFATGNGDSGTGSIYSYGNTAAAERSLGSLASGSFAGGIGVSLTNQSGLVIDNFSVQFTGEWWRRGGSGASQSLAFSYGLGVDSLLAAGSGAFVSFTALNFATPNPSSTAGALDGNLPANRTVRQASVTGIQWLPGQLLVLRWVDSNDAGSDDGLAIDDFSFSTVANRPPIDLQIQAESIAENSSSASTDLFFGQFSTMDEDANESFSYSLIDGDGSTHNDLFRIENDRLYFRQGGVLDYEVTPLYSIRVRTTDSAGNYIEKPIQLAIEDLTGWHRSSSMAGWLSDRSSTAYRSNSTVRSDHRRECLPAVPNEAIKVVWSISNGKQTQCPWENSSRLSMDG